MKRTGNRRIKMKRTDSEILKGQERQRSVNEGWQVARWFNEDTARDGMKRTDNNTKNRQLEWNSAPFKASDKYSARKGERESQGEVGRGRQLSVNLRSSSVHQESLSLHSPEQSFHHNRCVVPRSLPSRTAGPPQRRPELRQGDMA
ncbi:hypothetical protein E2C01_073323 [Portunus trituberculatus]|uniref:Uncharacterized protein n=1 Tax=Portunus trituberculatus TaxID=210409 RepID=A0A5B7I9I2_PORTR|nr:hypothetical protein [Portunus trituberculatus]